MNIFYKFYCRGYQKVLKMVSLIIKWPKVKVVRGINSVTDIPKLVIGSSLSCVIIVTDKTIVKLTFMERIIKSLQENNIQFVIYYKTIVNPTIDNVEEAVNIYKKNQCEGIIAIGGGSSMDCAKALGARISNPNKTIPKMKGLLKVRKKIPPLFAIPTTAGTGSEATIAAVITDPHSHEKYAINDFKLIPKYAILDPVLTVDLPKAITATTGMDALTHAIEAYIGKSNTKETKDLAKKSIKLIYDNIYRAYEDGKNLKARENMQLASYYAGVAFTKAYVGYVHAIAHTLGGYYSIPHGLANAVILPVVLESYGATVNNSLAELADYVGISSLDDSQEVKARKLIEGIKELNRAMDIPRSLSGIECNHIKMLARRALEEAHPLYPVPRIFTLEDIEKIYIQIKE